MKRCVCVGLLLLLSACPQAATTSPDEASTTTTATSDEPPVIPSEPANKAAGDEIDATIPIVGGDAIELSSLRGRPVLLEISASWELGFAEAHAVYAQLLEEHPELVVVLVVADPQDAGLDGLAEQFTLAWDPAGALAARLSVATLPTMFVIDRGGRVASVVNGWDEAIAAELMDAVAKVDAQ